MILGEDFKGIGVGWVGEAWGGVFYVHELGGEGLSVRLVLVIWDRPFECREI
jgi:hypothetical protein